MANEIVVKKPKALKRNINLIIVFLIIISSGMFTGFNIIDVLFNLDEGMELIVKLFFPPKWNYAKEIADPLQETIQMAIVGTFIGALLAIPFSVIAANNYTNNKYITIPLRFMLNIFRTIPAMVLAALFVAVFGIGAFSGVLALSIFTFGLVSKLTFESIEAIDEGQVEALTSLGANRLNTLRYAIVPQVLPQYLSYTIYAFEVNIRAAAVLGYVGAGGIGQKYDINLSWRRFDNVGMIILVTFAVVLVIDLISSYIRGKLV